MNNNIESLNDSVLLEFPVNTFEINNSNKADNTKNTTNDNMVNDFSKMLEELNRQVNNADGTVTEMLKEKDDVARMRAENERIKSTLEDDRFKFDKQIKDEYQKLNELKMEFEKEKNKVFGEIQASRDEFAKKQRDFDKYREEQLAFIENSKKTLRANYAQFEQIVSTFNAKVDKYKEDNNL